MVTVNSRCSAALATIGLDKAALSLAEQARTFSAPCAATTFKFLREDEEIDGDYIAEITLTVKKVE